MSIEAKTAASYIKAVHAAQQEREAAKATAVEKLSKAQAVAGDAGDDKETAAAAVAAIRQAWTAGDTSISAADYLTATAEHQRAADIATGCARRVNAARKAADMNTDVRVAECVAAAIRKVHGEYASVVTYSGKPADVAPTSPKVAPVYVVAQEGPTTVSDEGTIRANVRIEFYRLPYFAEMGEGMLDVLRAAEVHPQDVYGRVPSAHTSERDGFHMDVLPLDVIAVEAMPTIGVPAGEDGAHMFAYRAAQDVYGRLSRSAGKAGASGLQVQGLSSGWSETVNDAGNRLATLRASFTVNTPEKHRVNADTLAYRFDGVDGTQTMLDALSELRESGDFVPCLGIVTDASWTLDANNNRIEFTVTGESAPVAK